MRFFLLVLVVASLAVTATAFEITEKSEAVVTIPQGSTGELFCTSDTPYDFCKWFHGDKECLISKDSIDEASTCKEDENIEWVVDSHRCGIRVTSVSRAVDAGDWKCAISVFGDEETLVSYEKFQLDVTVPSSVQFVAVPDGDSAVDFASEQTVAVEANTDVEFACQASGGHPEPHIRAVFGVQPDVVDESGFDFELAYDTERDQREEHEDGTVSLTRIFTLNAKPHDCGKYVKCSVVQVDDATGEHVEFPEDVAATVLDSRKVMVEFGPEPLHDGPLKPVMFVESDDAVTVTVVFEANPPPENNEVIWHINPSGGDAADDSIVLQADETIGSEDVGIKYESPGLNVSGHHVTAVLRVFDPYPEMTDWSYYLEVRTAMGERQYGFNLIYVESLVPKDYDDPDVGHEGQQQPEVDGLGAGVIAVIVLIVISAVLVVLVLFVAKKNNLCCFKYKGVPTKDTGVPCERHGPIIKNGGSAGQAAPAAPGGTANDKGAAHEAKEPKVGPPKAAADSPAVQDSPV